jgi:hypothetical protein
VCGRRGGWKKRRGEVTGGRRVAEAGAGGRGRVKASINGEAVDQCGQVQRQSKSRSSILPAEEPFILSKVIEDYPVRDYRQITVNNAVLAEIHLPEQLAATLDQPAIDHLHQVVYCLFIHEYIAHPIIPSS